MKNLTRLQALTSYCYFVVDVALLYPRATGKVVLTGVVIKKGRTYYDNISSAYELSNKKI